MLQDEAGWALAGLLCIILPILGIALWVWLLVWVYRDAKSRGMEAALWVLVVAVVGLLGLIIYLVVRRDHSTYRPAYYPPPGYAYPPPPPPPQAYRDMGSAQPGYVVEEFYVDEFGRRVPPPGY